ncbi:MAG: ABC transporter ATP-binding protein [Deltaproteobacteria bacterium]|nr:ABC transporter ATP-binding protein [Deltaproteobacteria bacterium]
MVETTGDSGFAVRCHGVVKIYGDDDSRIMALRGVHLEVRTGELMMLVGPSGCGKTTLISVIAGILDHEQGSCLVFDRDLQAMAGCEKVRYRAKNIGFVFQSYNLLPALTAAENVAMPLIINGVKRKEAVERASEILSRVGMATRVRSLPLELSGGQQQRVAIARAIAHNPRLIVCDEPTSALDHETGHKVMEMLKSVAMDGNRALVIVTHDSRIFEFADRIARMDDGHIEKVVDSPAEL